MPSPIAHSLMGYLIYRVTTKPYKGQKRYIILLYLFIANVPDLDFLPGFFVGSVSRYHHGISHSIGFSLLFALGSYFILGVLMQGHRKKRFAIVFCLYFSHVVLDFLTKAPSNPYGDPVGEQFFWPFSNEYYISPFAFFQIIHFEDATGDFLLSLFSLHNLMAVSVEFAILSTVILTVEFWKHRRKNVKVI